jgi:hypothetical protein
MGMSPNPFAAIITLPSGTITGDLRQVWGWELNDQIFAGDEKVPELPVPRVITSPKPPTWDVGKVEKTANPNPPAPPGDVAPADTEAPSGDVDGSTQEESNG